jgi:hypothetical protein
MWDVGLELLGLRDSGGLEPILDKSAAWNFTLESVVFNGGNHADFPEVLAGGWHWRR